MDYSSKISQLLETYSLVDILELNDLTEEEIVTLLLEQEVIHLPDIVPL